MDTKLNAGKSNVLIVGPQQFGTYSCLLQRCSPSSKNLGVSCDQTMLFEGQMRTPILSDSDLEMFMYYHSCCIIPAVAPC